MTDGKIRCAWCGDDPLYVAYHDQEWGRPLHDEQKLFELLVLEGMQAGLSWITILRKRENFRNAFDKFAVEEVASYGAEEITRLLGNAGIIRNRLKITAAVQNANAFLRVQKAFGTFDKYICREYLIITVILYLFNLIQSPLLSSATQICYGSEIRVF